jgi:purine-binding chemotaxis protein CheW
MSNDDERMDRAKRIREMREGSREGDSEAADGGEPEPPADDERTADEEAEITDDEEPEPDETDEAESSDDETEEDEGAEKQTMEDLVESAAADADDEEAEELELDDNISVEDDFDEMEAAAAEEEVPAQVADAVSGGSTEADTDEQSEMTEPDDTTETEPQAADDGDGVTAPLPDTETLEDALDEDDGGDVETAAPDGEEEMTAAPGAETETETQEEETRVLEFRLDDEYYCLDIAYIEEIVKEETITRVPNTPEYVQGVVDLRGQITTILNPKVTLDKENTEADQLIVVFDSEAFEDQGHIGWVVDDVRQVSPITDSEVNDPPVEDDHINGVIDREDDDQFVIWTSPDLALEEADG